MMIVERTMDNVERTMSNVVGTIANVLNTILKVGGTMVNVGETIIKYNASFRHCEARSNLSRCQAEFIEAYLLTSINSV